MTPEEHRARHLLLHSMLDELLADWIAHGNGSIRKPIVDLVAWNFRQTQRPDHDDP